TATLTYGDYDVVLTTTLTNFPGAATGATLTTTANLSTHAGAGSARTLTILSEVVDDPGGPLSPLSHFTAPPGPPFLVTNDVRAGPAGGFVTTGTADLTTFVNGTGVPLTGVSIPAALEVKNQGLVPTGPSSFTLTNRLVLAGLNLGIPSGGLG